jgi:PTS system mannose-specific IIB component
VISLVRVDNRLIHGQVVEAWLPGLKVAKVVVADDEAAGSPLIRAAMGLAVPSHIEVSIQRIDDIDFAALAEDEAKVLLVVREVTSVTQARRRGLTLSHLNLGNVHFASGRKQMSSSVFLSPDELNELKILSSEGVEIEARAVPSDRPVQLAEMEERIRKG